jgi:hypothetical protein
LPEAILSETITAGADAALAVFLRLRKTYIVVEAFSSPTGFPFVVQAFSLLQQPERLHHNPVASTPGYFTHHGRTLFN